MIIDYIKQIERLTNDLKEDLKDIDPITYTPAGRKQKSDDLINAYNEEVYKIALKAESELETQKEGVSIKSFDVDTLKFLLHMIETYSLDTVDILREYINVFKENDFAMYCIKNALIKSDKLKNIAYEIEITPSKNEIIKAIIQYVNKLKMPIQEKDLNSREMVLKALVINLKNYQL